MSKNVPFFTVLEKEYLCNSSMWPISRNKMYMCVYVHINIILWRVWDLFWWTILVWRHIPKITLTWKYANFFSFFTLKLVTSQTVEKSRQCSEHSAELQTWLSYQVAPTFANQSCQSMYKDLKGSQICKSGQWKIRGLV